MSCSPYKSAFALYQEKIGAIDPDNLDGKEWVRWGNLLERPIAEEFAQRSGRRVRPAAQLLRSTEHPWMLATLDFWQEIDGVWCPLEIKNVNAWKASDFDAGIPEHHVVQLHQQMAVTGAPVGSVAALIGGNQLVWDDIEPDPQTTRKLVYRGAKFWEAVQRRKPPEVDPSESTEAVLKRLHSRDDGETIDLPDSLCDDAEKWAEVAPLVRDAEKKLRGIKNRFRDAMGSAQRGELSNGYAVTWKASESTGRRTLLLKEPR